MKTVLKHVLIMHITVYEHVQTMSERIQTIYEHFAAALLNLFRQQLNSFNS